MTPPASFKAILIVFAVTFVAVPALAANVTGQVTYSGQVAPLQALKMESDPACKMLHPEGATSEELIVQEGAVKNVFVYVKEGLSGKFDPPKTPSTLDQKGCRYEPHVLGVQVNQELEIINSDDTLHNVHALPENSKAFNLGMPIKGMKLKKKFSAAEVMVRVKCDVHPWMGAYIGVLEHPFYAVTDAGGAFTLKDLPAGEYVLEAWHEKLGTQTQTVQVGEGASEVSFVFEG